MTENVTAIQGLGVSPLDVNRVAFSGPKSAWSSRDGGETWTKNLGDLAADFTRGSKPLAYHPTNAGEFWLAGNRKKLTGSLWRTTDDGATWSAVGGQAFENERANTIHFFPAAPNEVWVGTAMVKGKSTAGGLWCSADGGGTWRKVWDNRGAVTKQHGPPSVASIARNADRASVFASNTGVWQVTATDWNNPATYVVTPRAFQDQNVPNVTTLADGTFWASEIGDRPGAPVVSADGVTWTERPLKVSDAYVPEWTTAEQVTRANRVEGRDMLVQDVRNPARWLLTGRTSAHLSEDNGITWRYQAGGMAGMASHGVDFDQTNPNRVYLSTSDGGIFVINDGGLSGQTVQCSRHAFDELHTYHETMTSTDGRTIVGAGVDPWFNRTVMIRSDDGGATWAKITPAGLPLNYEGVTRAVMSLEDPNDFLVLLGYNYGHAWGYHDPEKGQPTSPGLYRTRDGGKTFVQVNGHRFEGVDTGMHNRPEYSYLERDGVNPNVRYLTLRSPRLPAAEGLWRSTDGGTTWQQRKHREGGNGITAFAVDPTVEGRLWAGSNRLRRSDDGGGSWTDVGDFEATVSVSCHTGRVAVLGRKKGDEFNKIYASPDNGATWQEMTSDTRRMMWAKSVVVDPWRAGQIWVTGARSYQVINPPNKPDPLLAGTVSGVPDAANAFDGKTETTLATPEKGGFAQIDLGDGKSARVTSVRYFRQDGFEDRVNGGRFEGSADGSTWTPLASIGIAPTAGWQTLAVGSTGFFRHLRYTHPEGPAGVAEIEFHGSVATTPALADTASKIAGLVGQSLYHPATVIGYPTPKFRIASGQLPAGLSLNPDTGVISGTPTTAATGTVNVEATNGQGSYTAPVSFDIRFGPRLTATAPDTCIQPTGTTGEIQITLANDGNEPLPWSTSPAEAGWLGAINPKEGTLAPGASAKLSVIVNAAGIADGKTAAGVITFASNDPVRPKLAVPVRLTAGATPLPPAIAEGQRAEGYFKGTFTYTLQASNAPARWEITSGSLPAGVAFDSDAGVLYGTPSETGRFTIQFTAANPGGTSPVSSLELAITDAPTAANYNFNVSQTHFEQTFLQTPGTPWASNAGVGGSGGLVADSNEHAAVVPEPILTFTTAGQSVKSGVTFQARVGGGTAGGDNVRLGLKRQNKLPLAGDCLNVGLNKATNEPLTSALVVDSRAAGSSVLTKDSEALVLVDKDWYSLESTVTYDGSDQFTIMSHLYHLGPAGIDKAKLIDSYNATRSGLGSLVNVPLFVGFSGRSAAGFGGVVAFDNFFVTASK